MCAGILVPSDEFQYWGEAARMSTKMNMKERARGFMELFQPISKDFGNMSTLSMPECIELVEMTQDTLDEVWKQTEHDPPYPEPRMLHLMDIIGRWCCVHLKYNCGFFCLYTSRFISWSIWTIVPFSMLTTPHSNKLLLTEHKSKNLWGVQSFIISPAKAWNTLSNNIRASASISIFKTALKTHLYKAYFE